MRITLTYSDWFGAVWGIIVYFLSQSQSTFMSIIFIIIFVDRTIFIALLFNSCIISSTAPLSVPHLTTQDTKIYGYDVPKNTVLFANVYSACIDPIHWEKPQDFIPDRFITTNGKHRKTDAFLPFSAGKNRRTKVYIIWCRNYPHCEGKQLCMN